MNRNQGSKPMRQAIASTAFAAALLLGGAAHASSPDAWAAHAREVEAACLKASGFTGAKLVGKIATFPDETGFDVVLVRGRYPQPHMKNQTGRMYCLFDRKAKKAVVSEAELPKGL